jgi:putative endonuclease
LKIPVSLVRFRLEAPPFAYGFGWLTPSSDKRRPFSGEGVSPEALAKGGGAVMYYVYLLRSINFPDKTYIGFSEDLKQRIADHNSGKSIHTSKYAPLELVSYHAFANKRAAQEFEHYLKTGSGQAFAKKRFWK